MNERIMKMMSCFEPDMQRDLIDFCTRISKIQADVFILMARKASCFFNCLEELGLVHFNGYVTSERILDMNCEWLSGKTIVIIDDAIVSGTSINRVIDRLVKVGVASITVHVLTVNSKWYQSDMLTNEYGESYLYPQCNVEENEKCIELCYSVVKSILIQPRPYDIDFPYYDEIEIKEEDIEYLLNRQGWNYYEITTVEQKKNDIFTVTILPTESKLKQFEKRIKCNFLSKCLVKIRIYGTYKDKNKKMYSLRIVPMIVFDKMLICDILNMYAELIPENDRAFFDYMFTTETSKLRLIQFFFSNRFAEFWVEGLPKILKLSQSSLSFEDRNLSFIFPEDIDIKIGELCKSGIGLNHVYKCASVDGSNIIESDITSIDCISLEARLIEPFIKKYYDKELPCRELVLVEGKKVFDNEKYDELLQRLNKGITVYDMINYIQYAREFYDIYTRVSLFVDRAIDMGMIVPITQVNDGYVYRAFRHGEDVLFGKREEILYLKLLHDYQDEAKNGEGITHICTEKMIVLFSKLGIKTGLLQPYISNFTINPRDDNGNICRVLRVKTYLKGPVGLVADVGVHKKTKERPYVTEESKSIWFTNIFIQKKNIEVNKQGLYCIPEIDTSSITPKDLAKVQNIAILLGEVCNPQKDTGITFSDDELTKISTCLNAEDAIKAMAAEINIFSKEWEYVPLTLDRKTDEKIISEGKKCKVYEALNSAYMKFLAYETGEAKELLKKVKFARKTDQNMWESWFDDILLEDKMNCVEKMLNQDILKLYNESKYLVLFSLYAYQLLLCALFINFKYYSKSKKYAYIEDSYEKISEYEVLLKNVDDPMDLSDTLKKDNLISIKEKIKGIYPDINIGKDVNLKINDQIIKSIIDMIDSAIKEANIYLEKVCCVLGEQGRVSKMIIYNQILAIPFAFRTEEERDYLCDKIDYCYNHSLNLLKNSRRENTQGEEITIEYLTHQNYPDIAIKDNIDIIWFVARGYNSGLMLAKLALNIFYTLANKTPFRVIYFGDISYKYSIKKSENKMSDFLCNSFYRFIEDIPASMFQLNSSDPAIITMTEDKIHNKNQFLRFINGNNNAKARYRKVDNKKIKATSSSYTIECYKQKFKYSPNKEVLMTKKDIGIITVLQEEASAVKEILGLQEECFKLRERLYYSGCLEGDKTIHSVIMTQQLSQGEVSVVSAYEDMVKKYNPSIIFLVGIAGGVTKAVDYCSVILGNQIISYDLSKDTKTGIQRRGDTNKINAILLPLYQRFLQVTEKCPIVATQNSKQKYIHITESNIGSGSAVIANELSKITEWLHNYNDKIDAVEMEAYGLSSAFYEGELSEKNPKFGICVIRGISDLADSNKGNKQEYRIPAAKNAAIVLKEFIKIIPSLE